MLLKDNTLLLIILARITLRFGFIFVANEDQKRIYFPCVTFSILQSLFLISICGTPPSV
jgi:hypothetical protein